MDKQNPPERIVLTKENLHDWPKFQKLHDEGKIVFDKTGKLRYRHGAPVGNLILSRVNKDGEPVYKELAEGWFDPDGPAAKSFKWPE